MQPPAEIVLRNRRSRLGAVSETPFPDAESVCVCVRACLRVYSDCNPTPPQITYSLYFSLSLSFPFYLSFSPSFLPCNSRLLPSFLFGPPRHTLSPSLPLSLSLEKSLPLSLSLPRNAYRRTAREREKASETERETAGGQGSAQSLRPPAAKVLRNRYNLRRITVLRNRYNLRRIRFCATVCNRRRITDPCVCI